MQTDYWCHTFEWTPTPTHLYQIAIPAHQPKSTLVLFIAAVAPPPIDSMPCVTLVCLSISEFISNFLSVRNGAHAMGSRVFCHRVKLIQVYIAFLYTWMLLSYHCPQPSYKRRYAQARRQLSLVHIKQIPIKIYPGNVTAMTNVVCPWWRHQMETFSALLAICAGNSPVPSEFSTQRPVTRSFDVFFELRLNKLLSKQSWGWWFETLSCPSWRYCNAMRLAIYGIQFNYLKKAFHLICGQ